MCFWVIKNRLNEAVHLNTNNICFGVEIRKKTNQSQQVIPSLQGTDKTAQQRQTTKNYPTPFSAAAATVCSKAVVVDVSLLAI